ncbi:efflux RND transporter periplasmic adaptor subunit [Diplocloster agilis]|uniref:efflux RND transporter periplasmic adaptor subunit n=1 Tax=Diplocloster agilis TaxID=2850323 RepID=UPI0008227561|nr:efflux RND transporter periplasmic adaptor subunit [Suonthocola fibrivorans]MCU6732718.1 efflux RND transporter periplasmic adaptor subunit [Suonthocola fibrivorans]SCI58107.1 Macrolide-specific efflux protein macA precursor [uncultured Clostridium sp.]
MRNKQGKVWNFIKRHRKLEISLVLIVAVGVVIVQVVSAMGSKTAMPVDLPQQTAAVERRDLMNTLSATGTIESQEQKEISSTLQNYEVKTVNVAVGDQVQEGDVLLEFDSTDLEDSLQQARDELSVAQAQNSLSLKSAQRDLESTKTNVEYQTQSDDQKVENAEQNLDAAQSKAADAAARYQAAVDDKNAKKTALDEATAAQAAQEEIEALTKAYEEASAAEQSAKDASESADNAVTTAQNNYDSAVTDRAKSYESNVSSVEKQEDSVTNQKLNNATNLTKQEDSVQTYEENLEKCTVTAPWAGTVTEVNVEAGDTYTSGTLVKIEDCAGFVVTANIDEYDISKISQGMKVYIKTDATGDEELEGEVTFVSPVPVSSSSSGASGGMTTSTDASYEIKVSILTPAEELRIGMTAKLSIVLESVENVLAVPYDAVQQNANGDSVIYVLDGGKGQDEGIPDGVEPEGAQAGETQTGETAGKQKAPAADQSVQQNQREIVVTTGLETDYYIEVQSDELTEGMQVITPTYSTTTGTNSSFSMPDMGGGMMGGGGGGMPMGR